MPSSSARPPSTASSASSRAVRGTPGGREAASGAVALGARRRGHRLRTTASSRSDGPRPTRPSGGSSTGTPPAATTWSV